ncbi:hypothetical protein [Wukongibacter sp. M2B1]|uniref:hypothetical protein n=1 Tax=Wukongibacter sp. M2B1 TaxID=3088895 RepID=UPI003D7B5A06
MMLWERMVIDFEIMPMRVVSIEPSLDILMKLQRNNMTMMDIFTETMEVALYPQKNG